jgi:hypothetical protein
VSTDHRVSWAPPRLALAHWALALLSLVASLLGVALPARAAPPAATGAHRHGRRVAGQGGVAAPSVELRERALRDRDPLVVASGEAARATTATRPPCRPAHRALPALLGAPGANRNVDALPRSRVFPARWLAGVVPPGRPAPSSRAPPIG